MFLIFFKSSNPVNKASNYKTDRIRLYMTSKMKYEATLKPSTEGLSIYVAGYVCPCSVSVSFHFSIIRISRGRFNRLFLVKNSSVGITNLFSKPKNKNALPTDNYY